MMHDELKDALDDGVYRALDAYANTPVKEKDKIVTLCRSPQGVGFFNPTTNAAFGHQIALSLTDGEFFEATKRGLALAAAGRSAAQPGFQSSTFGRDLSALTAFTELKRRWGEVMPAFNAPSELSGTNVDTLWLGAMTVMELRAERSTHWNVPEVHAACVKQLQDMLTYRTAVATYMAKLADPSPAVTAKNVNTAYLQLFLPFWWEHILGKARLDEAGIAKEVKSIMTEPPPAPAPPPPAPAPGPAPYYGGPAYAPPMPVFYPPPPGFAPHALPPMGWPHPPAPPTRSPQRKQRFLGKPPRSSLARPSAPLLPAAGRPNDAPA